MTNGDPEDSMVGLAKRWLKTQLTFHGDPIRSSREQQEAREIEHRMREKQREDTQRAVAEALIPPSWKRKMADWEQQAEERKIEREAERVAEHAARDRAFTSLTLSGDITGSVETEIPVTVHPPAGEDTTLVVVLEPFDPVTIAGHTVTSLQFAIPEYRGSGSYDLLAMASGDTWIESWDPLWFQFWIDGEDESFFWTPDYGQATAEVDETSRTIAISLPMQDASSRSIRLTARVRLPESGQAA